MVILVDYCKILNVEGQKCEKLRQFLRSACERDLKAPEPVLWKGRDLKAEWKKMYKRLTGG